jgi:hypothetical protein
MSFIVTFKDNTPAHVIDAEASKITSNGGSITHRYDGSLLGFAAVIPDNHLNSLVAHEHVEAVEADGQVSAFASKLLQK